ncbi:MAG: OmpA family protein [Polyangiaceae bacterium]|nr:OmpA family protein [Polyangiaceae bacterium]
MNLGSVCAPGRSPEDRGERRHFRRFIALLSGTTVLLGASCPALAQTPRFDVSSPEPSYPGDLFFSVPGVGPSGAPPPPLRPRSPAPWRLAAALTLEDTTRVLVARSSTEGEVPVLSRRDLAYLGVSILRGRRVTLNLLAPLLLHQGEDSSLRQRLGIAPAGRWGDLRLGLRLVALEQGTLSVALQVDTRLPTGSPESLQGEGAVRWHPRLTLGGAVGPWIYGGSGGLLLRPAQRWDQGSIGPAASFGAALAYRIPLLSRGKEPLAVLLSAEVQGSHTLTGRGPSTPLEGLLGLQLRRAGPGGALLAVGAAAGPGLTSGPGTPGYRGLLTLQVAQGVSIEERDRDGDGIPNQEDACPEFAGIPSEDPARHGCQEDPDKDGDAIPDREDRCPLTPGVSSRESARHGCPPLPPRRPEPPPAPAPRQVCPRDPGLSAEDPGCLPPPSPPVKILEVILFGRASSVLTGDAIAQLQRVAALLRVHPELEQIQIEGHSDPVGDTSFNQTLSLQRAESAKRWLIERGRIDASRLSARGLGPAAPLAPNDSEEGRRKNRRVQFTILVSSRR